ncbi:MAG: signal peptidase I [Blastocatellia bacterium]|nr:signal peptidase I [Blastocatellia bacterium]
MPPSPKQNDIFRKLLRWLPTVKNRPGLVREAVQTAIVTLIVSLFGLSFLGQSVKVTTGSMKNSIQVGDYLFINRFVFGHAPHFLLPVVPQRDIRRGDIIVFKFPKNPNLNYVKRVVGLPGETIELRGVHVYINGVELKEQRFIVNLEYDRLHPRDPLQIQAAEGEPTRAESGTEPALTYQVFYGFRKIEAGTDDPFAELPSLDNSSFGVGSPFKIPPDHYFCLGDNRDNSEDSRAWGVVPRHSIIGRPVFVYYSNALSDDVTARSVPWWEFVTHSEWSRIGTGVN